MNRYVVIAIVLVAVVLVTWLDRRRRAQHVEQAGELAVLGGFTHETDTISQLPAQFELLDVREVFNVLRDRRRPEDEFGCNVRHRSGRNHLDSIVGVTRLTTPVPDLQLRRQGWLGVGRREELMFDDDDFDDRWIVSTTDPEFWRGALDPTVRAWLMTLPSGVMGVELEVNGGWVLATAPGTEIERIPEMLEHARTFAGHVGTVPR